MLTLYSTRKVCVLLMSTLLFSCGGGGSASTEPKNETVNSAPSINSFTSEISENSSVSVTYRWSVSDVDNDALSCVLNPGEGMAEQVIADCITTTSLTVNYTEAGDYDAVFTLTDAQNNSVNKAITNSISLPEPAVMAGDNQLVIYYNRPDGGYDGWILHLWNNNDCDAYADFNETGGTDWTTGKTPTGIDPNYGAYWLLDLKAGHSDCANFIVHKGDEKDIGGDLRADLTGQRMVWTLSGLSDLYAQKTLYPSGALIANTAAHWVTTDTVFWQVNSANVTKVRVYSAESDDLGYDGDTGIAGDNYIEFMLQSDNSAQAMNMPRYSEQSMFIATNADVTKAKQMLKGKLLAIAYDNNVLIAATYVQTPRVLDALYTSGTDDADETSLGITYSGSDITSRLWAPTAKEVTLKIYNDDKTLQSTLAMEEDHNTGIWSANMPISNDRLFYRYELTVYHPQNLRFETLETTDPYSLSLSTNGEYSQFVNLTDADLKPSGWDNQVIPDITAPEDGVIYEGHIRDFSILDESTPSEHRGKYLAFTDQDTAPVKHLKSLVAAGLTYFQLLPANDMASIDENTANTVNITNTVADLCAKNSTAPVCGVEDPSATLQSVLASYDPSSDKAQALVQAFRGIDSFNWGYDPKHFSTPDGSYATNPDGISRITEMRAMIKALHEMGLRVTLDVVYNHTNSSGLWNNSVLDKVVPGYYHRRDLVTGDVRNETCCQDTAPEHVMMNKLMRDSLVTWASDYKFDGFRFDIMSNNSVDSILSARNAVQAVDSDSYFYGEGWTRSEQGYTQANQNNLAGSEVGTFNDRPRDTIRSASLFGSQNNFADQDTIRLGLAGTLSDYQLQDKSGRVKSGKNFGQSSYAKDPADIINYVSKHDNETLWDQLQYGLPDTLLLSERVRAQNIAATIPLLSQGIPFFQIGGDFLRSKSMDRNSYDAGDWFNRVDFTLTDNNWNKGLPLSQDNDSKWNDIGQLVANSETQVSMNQMSFASDVFKEYLVIRHRSTLFRLSTAQEVYDRVGFHNTGTNQKQGLIVMSIDDGTGLVDIDKNNDAIVVVINGSSTEQSFVIPTASDFELDSTLQNSVDPIVKTAYFTGDLNEGTFTVPALTTAVFVKPQQDTQGVGLSAGVTRDAPDVAPFGNTLVYLRGNMNNWGNDGLTETDSFTYAENDIYNLEFTLTAGQQTFKIADANWSNINFGFDDVLIGAGSLAVINDSGNMSFTADSDGRYHFKIDASGETPILTITSIAPTFDCNALVDSVDVIPFSITGGGQLYVRGSHSGWNAEETYRLHYKGNNKYQAVATFDGDMQFKLASDDANWDTQLWAQAIDGTNINTENLNVGVSYNVAYDSAGTDNNVTTLPAGTYSFLLTLNEANPVTGTDVGSLIIQQCQPE